MGILQREPFSLLCVLLKCLRWIQPTTETKVFEPTTIFSAILETHPWSSSTIFQKLSVSHAMSMPNASFSMPVAVLKTALHCEWWRMQRKKDLLPLEFLFSLNLPLAIQVLV